MDPKSEKNVTTLKGLYVNVTNNVVLIYSKADIRDFFTKGFYKSQSESMGYHSRHGITFLFYLLDISKSKAILKIVNKTLFADDDYHIQLTDIEIEKLIRAYWGSIKRSYDWKLRDQWVANFDIRRYECLLENMGSAK